MNQINLMREVAVDGTHSREHQERIVKELISYCYKMFDKGYLDVCQLRILLDRI
jgi:hypothetical protein